MHRSISRELTERLVRAYQQVRIGNPMEEGVLMGPLVTKAAVEETCRRFVLMYVNDYTMRLGDDGRAALRRLYEMAHAKKLIQAVPPVDPI